LKQAGYKESPEPPAYPEFDRIRHEVQPIGQLRDSFIVATDPSGLIVIDQHVAHERVLLRLSAAKACRKARHPAIVNAHCCSLPPRQLVILDTIIPELALNGFEVEPFGPKTIAIKTAPAMLKATAVEKLLVELLDGARARDTSHQYRALKRKIAATVSCHAAIKINTPLDDTRCAGDCRTDEDGRADGLSHGRQSSCATICEKFRKLLSELSLTEPCTHSNVLSWFASVAFIEEMRRENPRMTVNTKEKFDVRR